MSVSFLSLNLFLRPPFVKTNSSDYKDARTDYFITSVLGSHDVYCLQEVFGALSSRKSRIIKAAMAKGYLHITESPSPSFFSSYLIDGGLLILSRFPILDSQFRTYSVREQPDSLSQKGLLYCKLLVHGAFINVITTHTQSNYVNSTVKAFNAQRAARRQQL
jgi:endonuclease/exonuclease/phosphatase family metal-dependent hydrolase